MKRILRGLAGLNFVGADLVEVAPAYDHAEITAIAAADIVHDFLVCLNKSIKPRFGSLMSGIQVMMQVGAPPSPHKAGPF